MNYLDGFSGYGGFHLGFEKAGWKFDEVYFSEIDKYAIANYRYNFPNSIYAGSITDVSRKSISNIDLFTFGWPCQDNSIAGKRKGQTGGTRSGLLNEAVRIIHEFKPRNFVAENVLGLLSVNKGIDIIESLKLLSDLNQDCPQYDIEMQLLNTRWVLPQNRERLFFVGHLRGSGSKQIFPIGENFKRATEGTTDTAISRCFTAGGHSGGMHSGMTLINSGTVSGYESMGPGDSVNLEHLTSKTRRGRVGKQVSQTLDTSCKIGIIQKDYTKGNSQGNRVYDTDGVSVTLSSGGGGLGAKTGLYESQNSIRRLTPIEAERLQGLPDDHTKYGIFDGIITELSDTQRYRLCGNGVSVPIIEILATKLKLAI